MSAIKQIVKNLIYAPSKVLISVFFCYEKIVSKIFPQLNLRLREDIIDIMDKEIKEVCHQNKNEQIRFKLFTPNALCAFRHSSFSTKEPELLEWIDKYGGEGAFYDIGANIGIYSIYYAKCKTGNTFSFEPSVFNLRQLTKNISLNNMSDRIMILPNPLSNTTGIAKFINGDTCEGGALNAFGVNYGYDGKLINANVQSSLLGFSLDDLLKNGVISEPPSLIKIDVDGIEHLILSGAKETLENNSLKSIYVEVNDNFEEQSEFVKIHLENAGFMLKEKRQSDKEMIDPKFKAIFNQIWIR